MFKLKYFSISTILIFFFILGCSTTSYREKKLKKQRKIYKIYTNYLSDDWEIRVNSIKQIKGYLNTSSRDILILLLIRALEDNHDAVKIESLKILAVIKPKSSLNKIKELSISGSENVRWFSLKTLTNFKTSEAFNSFAKNIHSNDWLIREQAIIGLLSIKNIEKNKDSIPYIILCLKDKNKSVKMATLEYLKIKNKRIYYQINKILLQSKKKKNINLLIKSLSALDGYILKRETKKNIISLLNHSNYKVRILALKILKTNERLTKLKENQ